MKRIFYFSLMLLTSAQLCAQDDVTKIASSTPAITAAKTASSSASDVVAQKPARLPQSQRNYVVIDAQKVIAETQLDREPVQELLKLQQSLQNEIKDLGVEIQKEEASLKAKATTLSPDAFKKKQEELEDKNQKAQLKVQRSNKQLQEEEMKTRFKVFQELHQYAQKVVDNSDTLNIIFEKSGGILAYSQRVDASDELSALIKTELAKKEASKKSTVKNNEAKSNTPKNNKEKTVAA